MFENPICGSDAYRILEEQIIRPSFRLLKGDVITFPSEPEVRLHRLSPDCDRQIPFVLVEINRAQTWTSLKSILGLKAVLSDREKYASSSPVNDDIARSFNLAQVYGHLAGRSFGVVDLVPFEAVGYSPLGESRLITKFFPVLSRIGDKKK